MFMGIIQYDLIIFFNANINNFLVPDLQENIYQKVAKAYLHFVLRYTISKLNSNAILLNNDLVLVLHLIMFIKAFFMLKKEKKNKSLKRLKSYWIINLLHFFQIQVNQSDHVLVRTGNTGDGKLDGNKYDTFSGWILFPLE